MTSFQADALPAALYCRVRTGFSGGEKDRAGTLRYPPRWTDIVCFRSAYWPLVNEMMMFRSLP
jgi:hypothetical protein